MSFKEIFDAIGDIFSGIEELLRLLGSFLWNAPWWFTVLFIWTFLILIAVIKSEDEDWKTRLFLLAVFLASGCLVIHYWPSGS